MHCAIVIRHPEHARFYSPIHDRLVDSGHEVSVFVRDHDHARQLLDAHGIQYEVLAGQPTSQLELVVGHAAFETRLLWAALRRNVDVLTSIGGLAVEHVAPLVGARSVVFVDWERGGVADASVSRLADVVCSPGFVQSTFGDRTVSYDGYHELTYLHPDRFEPSPDALDSLGIDPTDPYAVLGFVSATSETDETAATTATHLAGHGDVYFTHESAVPDGFGSHHVLDPTVTLDALAFADVCVGTSGTMAAEAAVLGTPSVLLAPQSVRDPRCASLADRYDLLCRCSRPSQLIDVVDVLLQDPEATNATWQSRRDVLLSESTDVVELAAALLADDAVPSETRLVRQ